MHPFLFFFSVSVCLDLAKRETLYLLPVWRILLAFIMLVVGAPIPVVYFIVFLWFVNDLYVHLPWAYQAFVIAPAQLGPVFGLLARLEHLFRVGYFVTAYTWFIPLTKLNQLAHSLNGNLIGKMFFITLALAIILLPLFGVEVFFWRRSEDEKVRNQVGYPKKFWRWFLSWAEGSFFGYVIAVPIFILSPVLFLVTATLSLIGAAYHQLRHEIAFRRYWKKTRLPSGKRGYEMRRRAWGFGRPIEPAQMSTAPLEALPPCSPATWEWIWGRDGKPPIATQTYRPLEPSQVLPEVAHEILGFQHDADHETGFIDTDSAKTIRATGTYHPVGTIWSAPIGFDASNVDFQAGASEPSSPVKESASD